VKAYQSTVHRRRPSSWNISYNYCWNTVLIFVQKACRWWNVICYCDCEYVCWRDKLQWQITNIYSGNLFIAASGEVCMWGSGSEGQLGFGADVLKQNQPTVLQMDDRVVQLACGYYHTMLVTGLFRIRSV